MVFSRILTPKTYFIVLWTLFTNYRFISNFIKILHSGNKLLNRQSKENSKLWVMGFKSKKKLLRGFSPMKYYIFEGRHV